MPNKREGAWRRGLEGEISEKYHVFGIGGMGRIGYVAGRHARVIKSENVLWGILKNVKRQGASIITITRRRGCINGGNKYNW